MKMYVALWALLGMACTVDVALISMLLNVDILKIQPERLWNIILGQKSTIFPFGVLAFFIDMVVILSYLRLSQRISQVKEMYLNEGSENKETLLSEDQINRIRAQNRFLAYRKLANMQINAILATMMVLEVVDEESDL